MRGYLRCLMVAPLLGCAVLLGGTQALAASDGPARVNAASAGPSWHIVKWFPRHTSLASVAAVSRRDAWAVGSVEARAAVFYWDGSTWQRRTVPGLSRSWLLYNVEATSAMNVWIVGRTQAGGPVVLRYDGLTWVRVPVPSDSLTPSLIAVLGPGDAWWAQPGSAQGRSTVWHWNGSSWTAVPAPGDVTGLDGRGHQVWLVTQEHGTSPAPATVLRWTGSGWQDMRLPDTRKLWWPQIAVSAGGEAWVQDIPVHGSPVTYHWTGQHWHKILVPATADGQSVTMTNSMTYDGHSGVWFQGTAHWDGTRWIVPALGPYPLTVLAMQGAVAPVPGTLGTWGIGCIDESHTARHDFRYFLAFEGAKP